MTYLLQFYSLIGVAGWERLVDYTRPCKKWPYLLDLSFTFTVVMLQPKNLMFFIRSALIN